MHPFHEHLRNVARSVGVPDDLSPDDLVRRLRAHSDGRLDGPELVSSPTFSVLPSPSPEEPTITVEVSRPINSMEQADVSVSEQGVDGLLKGAVWRELTRALVEELMRSGWVEVKVEDKVAKATIKIVQKETSNG